MNSHESITAPLSASRRAWNGAMRFLLYAAAAIICALLVFLIGYILYRGVPSLSWQFLTSEESVINDIQGILPAIVNTVYVIFWTLIIILPLGVGSAIYLTEYATNKKLVSVIEFATETLSGMPSIIFALVGMMVFCQTLGLGTSLMAGAFALVMMTLPTIIRTTQESLKTVPQSYREGSLALGSGKWHMIRTVVLPSSIDGIVTGCILAIGRIVGESAVLMFTAGHGHAHGQLWRRHDRRVLLQLLRRGRKHPHRVPLRLREGARGLRRGLRRRGRAARYRLRHKPRREIRRQEAQEKLSAGRA